MYNGPQDVSGNVNGMSGIKFALGNSGVGHTSIKKLKFQQCPGCEKTLIGHYTYKMSFLRKP